MGFTTAERATYGAIITVINTETGEQRIRQTSGWYYETGSRKRHLPKPTAHSYTLEQQIADVAAEVETWGPQWRVRSISTPQSIHSDIIGRTRASETNFEGFLLQKVGKGHLAERPGRRARM